jgi:hypothetical protein
MRPFSCLSVEATDGEILMKQWKIEALAGKAYVIDRVIALYVESQCALSHIHYALSAGCSVHCSEMQGAGQFVYFLNSSGWLTTLRAAGVLVLQLNRPFVIRCFPGSVFPQAAL